MHVAGRPGGGALSGLASVASTPGLYGRSADRQPGLEPRLEAGLGPGAITSVLVGDVTRRNATWSGVAAMAGPAISACPAWAGGSTRLAPRMILANTHAVHPARELLWLQSYALRAARSGMRGGAGPSTLAHNLGLGRLGASLGLASVSAPPGPEPELSSV